MQHRYCSDCYTSIFGETAFVVGSLDGLYFCSKECGLSAMKARARKVKKENEAIRNGDI